MQEGIYDADISYWNIVTNCTFLAGTFWTAWILFTGMFWTAWILLTGFFSTGVTGCFFPE